MLGIHAPAVGQARINGDFDLDLNDGNEDGMYYQISDEMRDSLVTFALGIAPEVRKKETEAVKRQREAKLRKRKLLRERRRGHGLDKVTYLYVL